MAAPLITNRIHNIDCIKGMQKLAAGSVHLAFADPPFNIGYDYDVYDDRKEREHYLKWSKEWIAGVHRVLNSNGAFWLAIGDEYAAELKIISQNAGFHCRSWVVWYYTFGVNCTKKFTRSHAHIFHFVKDPQQFTFNDSVVRVPSARMLVYADSRANPKGRLPDDTWILRPQDCVDGFTPEEDTWYFPRVAGTFKERAGFHGCQMPEQLLGRILRSCSNPGEIVLDPFSGSGTTLVVAKKLGREFVGFELSEDYAQRGQTRVEAIAVGDPLVGAAEPLMSAPATESYAVSVNGKRTGTVPTISASKKASNYRVKGSEPEQRMPSGSIDTQALVEAFRRTSQGFSADRVIADPSIDEGFVDTCRKLGVTGSAAHINRSLFRIRKMGMLKSVPTTQRTEIDSASYDKFIFASEIAWRNLESKGEFLSLDEILCDPDKARDFDSIAKGFAPGFQSYQYRWGALKLRKDAKTNRSRAAQLKGSPNLPKRVELKFIDIKSWMNEAGIYLVYGEDGEKLYAGESINLGDRMRRLMNDGRSAWRRQSKELTVSVLPLNDSPALTSQMNELNLKPDQFVFVPQIKLIDTHKPKLNRAILA